MKDDNNIEYVYAADGTRLKATHNTKLSAGRYSSRDRYYRGNLIFMRSNDKLPYTIYRRIKEQNPGKVIPYKKK